MARRAARVLLVDGAGRVLLLQGFDPQRPDELYWYTVGGGVDPGESLLSAGARELFEETGLRLAPSELGEPVWHDVTEFGFDGRRWRQEQDFFLVRVPSWSVETSGLEDYEREAVIGYRWWSVAELESTGELYYPRELPGLLRRLLDGDC